MKKHYVDYVWLIGFYGLSNDFNRYCNKHRGISLRRCARYFLLKSGKYSEIKHYRQFGMPSLDDVIKIAKTPWLGN